ncbi:chemotaxis protein CheX [Geobacter sp. AOG2]|uniref:chemotaxis protein CheX n=1 Tax=Geobacter sp. AOG2 TaxID=1566347 RepID=UPI001CC3F069|nr:chemotaxis protein CheX [Geobacter sp. AOG2]GFE60334.1 chemotaxis protein CheX [Geobacter sp. AOG2]
MAVKFFGQFLVEKGIVSREILLKAIELQEQKNLKFGEMAVAMGYVTQDDIARAHRAQLSRDIKVGDLLLEIGILTLTQLNEIITRQKNNHLYIGEALVLVGAITNEQLQQHLNEFKADQAPYISERVELPGSIANPELWEMSADLTYKMITRILGLPFRAGKCQTITMVDANHIMAAMDLSGDVDARFIISVSQELQKSVAKAILREASVDNEPPEVLEDTVMEFINVVCGNIAAKASQAGKIVNINPPVTIRPDAAGLAVPAGYTGLCFPILVGEGETMQLVLFIKN